MSANLHPIKPLVPLTQITENNIKYIKIGEDFVDLARLGMIGEYEVVEATAKCPKLYYRWSYQNGIWEIYATEHDLIEYNLLGVSGGVTPSPSPSPGPDPSPSPGPEPGPSPAPDPAPYPKAPMVDIYCPSKDFKWAFNGAVITFYGKIKWDSKLFGNYVPVRFSITSDYKQYMDTLKVTYKGITYDQSIFRAFVTNLNVNARALGQYIPIRFDFTDDIRAQYYIKIDESSILEPNPQPNVQPGTYPTDSPGYTPDTYEDDPREGDGIINTMPEVTTFLRGFREGSNMLRDECADDPDIIDLFDNNNN